MGKFIEEMTQAGVLLATGGLEPGGTRITSSGGKITVTDGPFTEAKEAIVGFALIEARSRRRRRSSCPGGSGRSSATARA